MIGINVTIENDKIVIGNLSAYSVGIKTRALPRGLRKIGSGTGKEAIVLLSGPRRGLKTTTAKSGRQRGVPQRPELAGGYPVPRVSGWLRRNQRWLGPSRSKSIEGKSFSTGALETLIYNPVEYAAQIHEGLGSSAKYGARPFEDDAFENFNKGSKVSEIFKRELELEKKKNGLG